MNEPRPAVWTYDETARAHFPTVLVVGCTADDAPGGADRRGRYGFGAHETPFQMIAYSALARAAGTDLAALRARCRALGGSPVVFAAALPGPAQGVDERQADRHAVRVFDEEVVGRVALVVLAGHREPRPGEPRAQALLGHAADAFVRHGVWRGVPTVETPAMSGPNAAAIRERLGAVRPRAAFVGAFAQFMGPGARLATAA